MHQELGDSLEHICAASRDEVVFDADAMAGLVAALRSGADFDPAVFARYYDLVFAIEDEDAATAARLFDDSPAPGQSLPRLRS